MMDPEFFDIPSEPASLDITRMPTVRLAPPPVVGDIARKRNEVAERHEMEARRLRSIADSAMSRFERASQATMARLEEFRSLERISVRTILEQRRYLTLRRELQQAEAHLDNEWKMIADLLRNATHHDASAEILRFGHVRQH